MNKPLWRPDKQQLAAANLTVFINRLNRNNGTTITDYETLYQWSINEPERFWESVWDFCGVIGNRGERTLINAGNMPGAQFFPEATLNLAENLLRRRDEGDALVFWAEHQTRQRLSRQALYDAVARLVPAFIEQGVKPGDRIAAMLPNTPDAIIAMLATAAIGAVWSSCSPDFGEQAVLERFGQIEPKLLIAGDGYVYNGKYINILPKLKTISGGLHSLQKVIIVSRLTEITKPEQSINTIKQAVLYEDFIAGYRPAAIDFAVLPFNHPVYILFSSGTTGIPKCIVHTAGGTLLQHLKEHQLHCDIKPGDRVFYFTTCAWMMWNWLVSCLASEATVLLYDGSPLYPDADILFDYADAENMTHFGTSAKYIDTLKQKAIHPKHKHRLDSLRFMASTGSPLVAESFDFVYDKIKKNIYLASISGGTDIVSCFVLGNPIGPVWRGEIPCRGLGMAVAVWNDNGDPVTKEKGELVCTKPFPSMPAGFWNDAEDKKYHAAYFDTRPGIWTHGDFAEITEHNGIIIYGRSDATLNPGGVRIGTAEIYRQVEQLDGVMESIAIGQTWNNDVRVILFVVLKQGLSLDGRLIEKIKQRIFVGASPRHVPAKVIQVADIPRTKSGKITELVVRDIVNGQPIRNASSLANPEALDLYKNIPELTE